MRGLCFFLPVVLLGQVPPSNPPAATPKPAVAKPAAPKPTAGVKPAARPATPPKPSAGKPLAAAKPKSAAMALTTDEEKTIYSLGLTLHRSLGRFDLSPAELEIVKRAMTDAAAGKPAVDLKEWGSSIDSLGRARSGRVVEREKAASRAYLDKAAAQPGAVKTPSGLIYQERESGSGASPTASDTVKVHYRGTLTDGTEFDSSYARNEPAQFSLGGVIPCWTEGVQRMKAGGKALLVCPSELAYGDRGRPSIPGGATLIFEIELLGIAGANP